MKSTAQRKEKRWEIERMLYFITFMVFQTALYLLGEAFGSLILKRVLMCVEVMMLSGVMVGLVAFWMSRNKNKKEVGLC